MLAAVPALLACGSAPGGGGGAGGAGGAGSGGSAASLAEDLTFTGDLDAHLTSGTGTCVVTTTKDFNATVQSTVGGRSYAFLVVMDHPVWHGPGTYPARQDLASNLSIDTAQVTAASTVYTSLNSSGTVTVASDQRSGTIDMGLTRYGAAGQAGVHVSGRWRCG